MILDYDSYYSRIGKNIAYYRKKKHLTQEGLALRSNISRTYISYIEANHAGHTPTLDILFRICSVLGIEPYQLFVEVGEAVKL